MQKWKWLIVLNWINRYDEFSKRLHLNSWNQLQPNKINKVNNCYRLSAVVCLRWAGKIYKSILENGLEMCSPPALHPLTWYYTLRINYDHSNLLIFSRSHPMLSLTLVRHQRAEMEVSRQLMDIFTLFQSFHVYFHDFYLKNTYLQYLTMYLCLRLMHFNTYFFFHLILSTF